MNPLTFYFRVHIYISEFNTTSIHRDKILRMKVYFEKAIIRNPRKCTRRQEKSKSEVFSLTNIVRTRMYSDNTICSADFTVSVLERFQ